MTIYPQSASQTTNRNAECLGLAATSTRIEGTLEPVEETHKNHTAGVKAGGGDLWRLFEPRQAPYLTKNQTKPRQ